MNKMLSNCVAKIFVIGLLAFFLFMIASVIVFVSFGLLQMMGAL